MKVPGNAWCNSYCAVVAANDHIYMVWLHVHSIQSCAGSFKETLTLTLEPETSLLAVQSIIFQLHTVVYCLLEATSALHSDQCFMHYIQ